jgi:hypothetical protein
MFVVAGKAIFATASWCMLYFDEEKMRRQFGETFDTYSSEPHQEISDFPGETSHSAPVGARINFSSLSRRAAKTFQVLLLSFESVPS